MSNYGNNLSFQANLLSYTNITGSVGSSTQAWENIYSKNNILLDGTKTATVSASGLTANRTYSLPDTNGKIVIGAANGYYGNTLPSSGVEGQVFFKTEETRWRQVELTDNTDNYSRLIINEEDRIAFYTYRRKTYVHNLTTVYAISTAYAPKSTLYVGTVFSNVNGTSQGGFFQIGADGNIAIVCQSTDTDVVGAFETMWLY